MTKNKIKVLIISAFLVIVVCCTQMQQPGNYSNNANNTTVSNDGTTPTPVPCVASADWVNNPQSGPSEIPLGANAQLCQFYQFSWQWFLAMMNAPQGGTTRNYQNQQPYPQLQAPGINSCTATPTKPRLFVRARKDNDNLNDFILPEDTAQAGGGNVIYDQNGNVVLYEVRFSRNECSVTPPPAGTPAMFPAGTIEMKVSYRQITPAEAPNYVNFTADINGDGTEEMLGMVGFHLVISTALHPEFVWATFEHKQNAPECQTKPDPNAKWSFINAQCAAQLPNSVNPQQCNLNPTPTPLPSPTPAPTPVALTGGTPTQICRVYHDGSNPTDDKYSTNVFDIDTLNTQLTSLLAPLGSGSPLTVLQNYQLVGAVWVNDITYTSDFVGNQRGSIQLANTTMETTFQEAPGFNSQPYTGTSNLEPATNCFACHGYTPGNNVAQSHIYDDIFGQTKKK